MYRSLFLALCALLVLTACGADRSVPDEAEEPTVSASDPSVPGAQSPPAREAVADLAHRLDVSADDVEVESVEEVTWRDGSLGCAEEGGMYTQALVDGSRIVLRAGGERYEYHSGGSRGVFLCEDPTQ